MNCKHKNGTPIKDHMLTMIGYLAEAQSHGSEIDADTQMEMIFESLSKEFIPFRTIFNLSGKNMSLMELMKQLQAFESIIKSKSVEANLTEAGTSLEPSDGKGKKIKQVTSKTSSSPSTSGKIKKKKKKNPKKAKCFSCGKVGHFKRDYKANLAKKGEGGNCDRLYIEACLVEESKDTWVIDSGATNYVCVSCKGSRKREVCLTGASR